MEDISEALKKHHLLGEAVDGSTVNSIDKSKTTVNSRNGNNSTNDINSITVATDDETGYPILDELMPDIEGPAAMLAKKLGDEKSLRYYQLLVEKHDAQKLLDIMYYVLDVARTRNIRSKALYFMAILKRKGLQTKFRKDE